MDGFKLNTETAVPGFDQPPNSDNGFNFNDDFLDLSVMDIPFPSPELYPEPDPGPDHDPDPNLVKFAPQSSAGSELDFPDDHDFSDTVLKFLNQILMEENMEEKPSMFYDSPALQAAEKSFYDVLGEKHPPSPDQPSPPYTERNVESPNENYAGSPIDNSTNSSSTCASNFADHQSNDDSIKFKSSSAVIRSNPVDNSLQSGLQSGSEFSLSSTDSFSNALPGPSESFYSTHLVSNIFNDSQSILLFKKGAEEARKFLPSGNQFIIDLANYTLPPESKSLAPEVLVKVEKDETSYSPNSPRGRKNHYREDSDLEEERNSKQSALYADESELSEMFDSVLLSTEVKVGPPPCAVTEEVQNGESKTLQPKKLSNGGKTRAKKQGNTKEVVDLRTLLVNCAHSVASDDHRTAHEQLKQIRQHCSPLGDGSQRLAHYFANGLEARLPGTQSQISTSKRPSAAHMLKAYQLYISASPFKTIAIFFANLMILKIADKATKLHIIDFGIGYGFQWPILIQLLSARLGGPPKLCITGIGSPRSGFRPAELVVETGRRLAQYCERFDVPFEYNAIVKKWETIQIEEFKIDSDEVLVVNTLSKFKNLFDETVTVDSPRDAVLKLIRALNPKIFVHSVVNGSYSAPFFLTRFREALYHFSALFDMFDTNIPREDQERLMFEKEFFGREIMNIVACEGVERVERPEIYKQWQVRNMRAGFGPLPLNQEIMKKLKAKVKAGCHKDFVIDEAGHWMVQGWKGRIVYASSCWVPA